MIKRKKKNVRITDLKSQSKLIYKIYSPALIVPLKTELSTTLKNKFPFEYERLKCSLRISP